MAARSTRQISGSREGKEVTVEDEARPKKDISATRDYRHRSEHPRRLPERGNSFVSSMTADRMPAFFSAQHMLARAKTSLTTNAQTSWTRPPEQ